MTRTLDSFFFVSPDNIRKDSFILSGDEFRHAGKVLRIEPGDIVFAADGQGNEYTGEYIEQTGSDSGKFSITNTRIRPTEPNGDVILLQALIKGDRFDT
ncbi:MAG: hypothetical protein GY863_13740, partial [bacterium]|nr:hypothetical protein [bacterium]